jgi:hypothetical protein
MQGGEDPGHPLIGNNNRKWLSTFFFAHAAFPDLGRDLVVPEHPADHGEILHFDSRAMQ